MVEHLSPYLYSRNGIYYFCRRIPEDLKSYYKQEKITLSLRTRNPKSARIKSASLASQLEEDWLTLRWRSKDAPLRRFLRNQTSEARIESCAPLLSEAREIYLKVKGQDRPHTFSSAVERATNNLINLIGDKPIDTYSRSEANLLRDSFFERGLSRGSVDRMFSTIRAVINFTAKEIDLPAINSFSGIYLGEEGRSPVIKRLPIPLGNIRSIQKIFRTMDDEARWLISIISDTGMRLSEAIGLHKDDVQLEGRFPHITLKTHPWRRLKTRGSERTIPLVGVSLWATRRACEKSKNSFLFPRYCSEEKNKANSASAALNKWLRPKVPNH
ncbi:MAG TPA: integrase [Rhodospirillales bacterium]|nr:integrase [Rhodospirillales bacterium]